MFMSKTACLPSDDIYHSIQISPCMFMSKSSYLPSRGIHNCYTGDYRLHILAYTAEYRHIWLLTWRIYACKYETCNTSENDIYVARHNSREETLISVHSNWNGSRYSYSIHCIAYRLQKLQAQGPYKAMTGSACANKTDSFILSNSHN